MMLGEFEVLRGSRQRQMCGFGQVQGDPSVIAGQGAVSAPEHLTSGCQLVQQRRAICRHTAWQHQRFQCAGGHYRSGQLLNCAKDAFAAMETSAHPLPGWKESG